ncbi:MAG TPA: 4a-hydroxytetrahydrobiopterin dehydratase [Acidimicrobiales bacterium]|nr:4a-hydroxytetrahydrobiopterin dehydratase [Acidimicrobiales bacterium]
MAQRLPDPEIETALAGLQWERRGDRLIRVANLGSFRLAVDFVNQVADLAEEADHHPDIALSWRTVTLELWTHTAGGITGLDLDLAARIDQLG